MPVTEKNPALAWFGETGLPYLSATAYVHDGILETKNVLRKLKDVSSSTWQLAALVLHLARTVGPVALRPILSDSLPSSPGLWSEEPFRVFFSHELSRTRTLA